ncbi:MAG: ABC transporter ATP-binding protein/permease [Muribaculaceae bacterium]|nr:ABC transporter ATP-binding protein/permease [Roseburia sp.]MCM1431592.1 ABC transporter ATP-binding protein/permease [Muribaculaceae bacterium]MCM1492057.1 ABC transporter ATP-binding protein/permease [Muribaculaceae bacterium]
MGTDYQKIFQENRGNNLKTLIAMYRGKYWQLFWSIIFFIIKHSPVWISPIILASMINAITNPGEDTVKRIILNSVFMLVMILQNIPTNYVHTYFYAKAIRQVEKELRCAMVHKLQQLSITYHTQMQSGRLQSKVMRDVEQIENLSAQFFITLLSIAVNVLAALVIVIFKNVVVFLFFLGTVPIAVLIMVHFRGKIKGYNKDFRKEMEETSVSVMEMVEMIPVTRAHALEERETRKMKARLEQVADKGFHLDMIQTYFGSVSWVAFQVFQVFCLTFTSFMALRGKISVGDVAMYQTYFGSIVGSIANIVGLIPTVAKGLESVSSAGDILLCEDVELSQTNRKRIEVRGQVEFDRVGFRYRDSREPVFSNLSFLVPPGETIAFVGASGAGKTTILNLIIGFMQATEGTIKIDGTDMKELDLHAYREHIAVVPQMPILFSGTLRENITYGMEEVTKEQLAEVIKAANLTELVESLPDGLDTHIQEHGGNLSGGQRQRISIARAFIRRPRLLILDEATSALDTASERAIQEATDRLTENRTTFIVAHRLSTVRNADRIAVIEPGGLKEIGSYEELMEKKGAFYRMCRM